MGVEEKWLFEAVREGLLAAKAIVNSTGSSSNLDSRLDEINESLQSIITAFDVIEKMEEEMVNKVEKLVRFTNEYIEQDSSVDDLSILKTIEDDVGEITKQAQSFLVMQPESLTPLEQESSEVTMKYENPVDMEMAKEWLNQDEMIKYFICCFSSLPANCPIKKRKLMNWLIGIGIAEEVGESCFQKLLDSYMIRPYYKNGNASIDGYALNPSVQSVASSIASDEGFFKLDSEGRPTIWSNTACSGIFLTTSRKDQVISVSSPSTAASFLFNLNVSFLKFEKQSALGMQSLTVLQLGRWQNFSKDRHINSNVGSSDIKIVDDTAFNDCLGHLKKLRHLGLQGVSGIKELSGTVKKLSDLRILDVQACDNLEKLTCLEKDKDTSKSATTLLKKLVYLDLSECYLVRHMPDGLNDLEDLQVLKGFVMGYSQQQGANKNGLCSLGKLVKLRKLSINFGSVVNTEEVELSCLKNLACLTNLTISWTNSSLERKGSHRLSEAVLALGWLPESLKKLDLRSFPLEEVPSGLVSEKLKNLEKLYFRGGRLQNLQPIANEGAFQQLNSLRFRYLKDLRQLTLSFVKQTFPSLNQLDILGCPLGPQQFFKESFDETLRNTKLSANFLVFPANAMVKRSHYVHYMVASLGLKTVQNYAEAERKAEIVLKILRERDLIKATFKKGTSKVWGYTLTLHPSYVRHMAIRLLEELGHLSFGSLSTPSKGNQVVILSLSTRSAPRLDPRHLFNLNARYLQLEEVTKMKTLESLQLGKWPGYVGQNDIRAVSSTTFFNPLLPLQQLTYLGLRGVFGITELPAAISGLVSLMVLDLRGCADLVTVHPNGIAALEHLLHLDLSQCTLLEKMPPDFQRLSSTLEVMLGLLMKDKDFSLSHFNDQKLRRISFIFCSDVKFEKQKLMFSSPHLRIVKINWGTNPTAPFPSDYDCQSLSLDWLPTDIEKLELCSFPRAEIPSQLVPSRFPHLKRLYIVGGSLCSLKHPNQEDVSWQQVEVLRLTGLKELDVDWFDLQKLFPSIRSAEVVGCPKVTSFPCEGGGIWIKESTTGDVASEHESATVEEVVPEKNA